MDTWIRIGYCCPQTKEGANQSKVQEWAGQVIRVMCMANYARVPAKSASLPKLLWWLLCNVPWLSWEYSIVPRFFIGGIFQLDMARANNFPYLIWCHTGDPVELKLLLGCTESLVGDLWPQPVEITFDVSEYSCFWGCSLSEVIASFWGVLRQQSRIIDLANELFGTVRLSKQLSFQLCCYLMSHGRDILET